MGMLMLKIVLYRQIIHIYPKYRKIFKIQSKGRKAGYGILNKQVSNRIQWKFKETYINSWEIELWYAGYFYYPTFLLYVNGIYFHTYNGLNMVRKKGS